MINLSQVKFFVDLFLTFGSFAVVRNQKETSWSYSCWDIVFHLKVGDTRSFSNFYIELAIYRSFSSFEQNHCMWSESGNYQISHIFKLYDEKKILVGNFNNIWYRFISLWYMYIIMCEEEGVTPPLKGFMYSFNKTLKPY